MHLPSAGRRAIPALRYAGAYPWLYVFYSHWKYFPISCHKTRNQTIKMVPVDTKIRIYYPKLLMERWCHFLSSELHVPFLHNDAKIRRAATRGTKVLDHLYMVLNYNVDRKCGINNQRIFNELHILSRSWNSQPNSVQGCDIVNPNKTMYNVSNDNVPQLPGLFWYLPLSYESASLKAIQQWLLWVKISSLSQSF